MTGKVSEKLALRRHKTIQAPGARFIANAQYDLVRGLWRGVEAR